MKIKILFAIFLTLILIVAGQAQSVDKAKLDQFFDRLAGKNKAMGSLTIARDGKVLYTRARFGYAGGVNDDWNCARQPKGWPGLLILAPIRQPPPTAGSPAQSFDKRCTNRAGARQAS